MTENGHKTRATTPATTSPRRRVKAYELESDMLKALSHPKRLLIIDLLSDGAERSVTQLQEETRLAQSNLSQNLAILRQAGLVTTRREANVVWYRVVDPRVLKALTLLRGVTQAQLDNASFLEERAAAKTREKTKRASVYGAVVLLTVGVGLSAFAFAHPVLAGGGLDDAASPARLMFQSSDLAMILRTCANAAQAPMPDMPPNA